MTLTAVVTCIAAYVLWGTLKALRRAPKLSVLTHRLSDRDSLVVVQQGDQTVYVGLYSEEVKEKEKTPDWFRSYYRN